VKRFGTCVVDVEWYRVVPPCMEAVAAVTLAAAEAMWLGCFAKVADAVEDATRVAIVVLSFCY